MVLGCKDFLLCCSAAAGPAFEGAKISQGMCASEGAIDHIKKEPGGIYVSTIDNIPAAGICGSGLVDAITLLLEEHIIDNSGKIEKNCLLKTLSTRGLTWGRGGSCYQKTVKEASL